MNNMWGDNHQTVLVCYFTGGTCILLSDSAVVEAMYTTKNKYFNKHPIIKDLTNCLLGKSILFAETSKEWKEARKTLSPAFYKGKLLGMIEIARDSMKKSINRLRDIQAAAKSQKADIDLMYEINNVFVRILLTCALGEDVS